MIAGKVITIFSDKEVLLNIGAEDGVEEDMEFIIFVEGDHIFDPDTNEDLGIIETIKGRIRIDHVMPKMSRAKTFSYQVKIPSVFDSISDYAGTRYATRTHKLEVLEEDISPLNDDVIVKVGDLVRSVK